MNGKEGGTESRSKCREHGLLLEKVLCVTLDNLKLTILPPFYLQSAVIISAKTHPLK